MSQQPESSQAQARFSRRLECTVGWICVLKKEYYAGTELKIARGLNDRNVYVLGRIGDHKVVINSPGGGSHGHALAHEIATDMKSTFPSIQIALIVGLGGGAPSMESDNDIRLGDVVVSNKVIEYKKGKETENGFVITAPPIEPPQFLLSAAMSLSYELMGTESLQLLVRRATANLSSSCISYARPELDQLFESNILHGDDGECCCRGSSPAESSQLVDRPSRRPDAMIQMHVGAVGSANQVLKYSQERDRLASEEDIICFEMEAAAVMHATKNRVGTITIRGISDYSDGHKNDYWHDYAAMTAAVCAKALLGHVGTKNVTHGVSDGDGLRRLVQGIMYEFRRRQRDALTDGNLRQLVEDALEEMVLLCTYITEVADKLRGQRNAIAADMDAVTEQVAAVEDCSRLVRVYLEILLQLVERNGERPSWGRARKKAQQAKEGAAKMERAMQLIDILIWMGKVLGRLGRACEHPVAKPLVDHLRRWTEVARRAKKLMLVRRGGARDRMKSMLVSAKLLIELGAATGIELLGKLGVEMYEYADITRRTGMAGEELNNWISGLLGAPRATARAA
ncbi:hypothetical protein LLEC1_04533 [Akanthomyces lecanii]|uniref:Nucleoside phosphorylase domain-containing protein n=1 Tax=Cordyceps confragosa TaxID=2714763 RepID=A0A179IUZ7_CORDF|nr:hypothetical protein LLEC1_04533 [Akanthomyces lecanii]